MNADAAAAVVVLAVIASGVPLGRRARRHDPGAPHRHPADTHGACLAHCRTCAALSKENPRR